MSVAISAVFGRLGAAANVIGPQQIAARSAFGTLGGRASVTLTRLVARGARNIGLPTANAPLVDPNSGRITPAWLQWQNQLQARIAAIEAKLGLS